MIRLSRAIHKPLHEILQWDQEEIDLQIAFDHEFPPYEPWHAFSVLAAGLNNLNKGNATPEDFNPLVRRDRERRMAEATPMDDAEYIKARWGPGRVDGGN